MGEFDHIVAALQSSPVVRALAQMGLSGDFSRLDGNQAKRHHFLPQFLLRGFAQERGGKERLFQMETASRGAPRPVDLRAAASRRRLHTAIDEDGEPSNRNEGYSTSTTRETVDNATPTDSRSQRTRASRRGGHIHQRARCP